MTERNRDADDRTGERHHDANRAGTRQETVGGRSDDGERGSGEWYETYFAFAEEALPAYSEHLATPEVVETMLVAEAEASTFFDVLGEEMDLDEAGVVAASVRPEPCPTEPLPVPDPWEVVLDEILGEIPLPQRCPLQPCPDPDPVFVPTVTAHLRAPSGDAIVHVDPVGTSSGIYVDLEEWCWDDPACDPFPHWWTEDGWGTVDGSAVDFDGHPVPFPA